MPEVKIKMLEVIGNLSKMYTELNNGKAEYSLALDGNHYNLSEFLKTKDYSNVIIEFNNKINCINCQREIKKTFNQGYCFPCFRTLASCDSCVMSPEKCHFHLGTCREPKWGEEHCMQDHVVYLANSSGLKVGLTRAGQVPTRWIDQGAVQALIVARVSSRYQAGLLEVVCKQFYNDRTNWQAMLKNSAPEIDLYQAREDLYNKIEEALSDLQVQFHNNQISWQDDEKITEICYPVAQYPSKITSFNLDKTNKIEGKLHGIKGQYLILDTGVINLRKYTGYNVKIKITA